MGQTLNGTSAGLDREHVELALIPTNVGQPGAIGGKTRVRFPTRVGSEPMGQASGRGNLPQIVFCDKDDCVPIDGWMAVISADGQVSLRSLR